MNKRTVSFIAMLIFGWVVVASTATAAPRGDAFQHGMSSPAQLGTVIEQSLGRDPTGHARLDPISCRVGQHDRSCASAFDYLEMFQKIDQEARLTKVSQLPEYLRSLVIRSAPQGVYWMACLSPVEHRPILHCVARSFHPGETVWVNPKTEVMALASDCTNPIQGPAIPVERTAKPSGCADILVPVEKGDELRLADYGPKSIATDRCTGLKREGEIDFESPFVERCLDAKCSFAAVDAALRQEHWETGSWRAEQDGYAVIRVPEFVTERDSSYRIVLCLRHASGIQSCGLGVQWFDYQQVVNESLVPAGDQWVARILSRASDLEGVRTRIGTPSVLSWHFGMICQ